MSRGTGSVGILLGQVLEHAPSGSPSLAGSASRSTILSTILARIGGTQTEIAVALAGQRADRNRKPIDIARDALAFRSREDRRRSPQS